MLINIQIANYNVNPAQAIFKVYQASFYSINIEGDIEHWEKSTISTLIVYSINNANFSHNLYSYSILVC